MRISMSAMAILAGLGISGEALACSCAPPASPQHMIEHQVLGALTRDDSAWARAWIKLVPRVTRRLSRRGASLENGVRFAARQLVLTCDLVDTSAAGADIPPGTAWGEVLALMEADQTLYQRPLVLTSRGIPICVEI